MLKIANVDVQYRGFELVSRAREETLKNKELPTEEKREKLEDQHREEGAATAQAVV